MAPGEGLLCVGLLGRLLSHSSFLPSFLPVTLCPLERV